MHMNLIVFLFFFNNKDRALPLIEWAAAAVKKLTLGEVSLFLFPCVKHRSKQMSSRPIFTRQHNSESVEVTAVQQPDEIAITLHVWNMSRVEDERNKREDEKKRVETSAKMVQ